MPFTAEQFFDVFQRYNQTVWPLQLVFFALALLATGLAVRGTSLNGGRVVSGILALLWLWMGIVYHLIFFRAINPAATFFGVLFVAQGILLAWVGAWRGHLVFRPRFNWSGVMGGLLLAYALVGYPIAGYLLGQRYPAIPTFGLPCPTTLFTIGVLLWAVRPMTAIVFVIPILWTALGLPAALLLGVREDLGLLVAGISAILFAVFSRRSESTRRSADAANLP